MKENPQYKKLMNQYNLLNEEVINEVENLKYLLDNTLIEYINLLSIHYQIKDLIFKRSEIKNKIYNEFGVLIIDEV